MKVHAPRSVGNLARSLVVATMGVLAACGVGGDEGAGDAPADSAAMAARAREDSLAALRARVGERVARPDSVRALYVNGWAAGGRTRMAALIRIADETEINAFVIDVKESDTFLVYDSTGIPLAKAIGADQRPASKWLPALVDTLRAHGIYPIARIVVFKDRLLAEKRPDLAIRGPEGETWLDDDGKPWVNPYHREIWDYNIAIAREALDMGFAEVQWDYVRFPDVRESVRQTLVYPGSDGKSREDNIRDFIAYSKVQLHGYQVPVTADVFGLVTHLEGDVGIGQNWEKVITTADAVLPMVYPSHYYAGMYGFDHPNAYPYEVIRISLEDAVRRTEYAREAGGKVGEIVPWLQAMSATWMDEIEYGPAHLREQIQAVYDSGLKSWTLWNPGSNYDLFLPALRPADGSPSSIERGGWSAPRWELPRSRLSRAIVRRENATRAAAPPAAVAPKAP